MKGRPILWADEELAWIEARADWPRRKLHALFCRLWFRDDVSLANLNALCKRRGWMTGRTGQFPKGVASGPAHPKGTRIPGSEKGWFRPGTAPPNRRPLWSERVGKDGYIEMKVPATNPYTGHRTRFMHKHRWRWERVNGPLPAGHALKCLDGDKTNTDPSNWLAVPRALLPRLAGGRWNRGYDDAPPELRPTLLAIAQLQHAAREARKRREDHG